MPSSLTRAVSELRTVVDAAEQRHATAVTPPEPLEFARRLGLEHLDPWQQDVLTTTGSVPS